MTLLDRLGIAFPGSSRRSRKQWIEMGRVRLNGAAVRRGDTPVTADDRVELGAPPPAPFPPTLPRVYEDDDLVVIDKPPGLLTIATDRERERTAYRLLADYVAGQPGRRLFIVHRLDRETSGLLVFAKSAAVKRMLQEQFQARTVERRYLAVVEGRVRERTGTLRSRLSTARNLRVRRSRDDRGRDDRGKEAITTYRVVEQREATALVELSLTTGRRGQIRAQLADLGHPIVGDLAYGARTDALRRVCLHATRLGFVGPKGRRLTFESPPPPAFARA